MADLEPDQPVGDAFNHGGDFEVLGNLCRAQHRTRLYRIARTPLSTSAGTPRRFAQDRCSAPSSRGGRMQNMRSELIRGAIGVLDSDLAFRATAQVWRERLTHRAYTRLSTVCAPPRSVVRGSSTYSVLSNANARLLCVRQTRRQSNSKPAWRVPTVRSLWLMRTGGLHPHWHGRAKDMRTPAHLRDEPIYENVFLTNHSPQVRKIPSNLQSVRRRSN